jgi:hypothetical protein
MVSSKGSIEVELQIVAYVTASFLTLAVYDLFICLNREITHIWRSKWGLVKVLYLVARYFPFVSVTIAMEERLSSTCNLITFTTIFAGAGIGLCALILTLRTYSIYNKSRKVLAIFGLSWILAVAVVVWAVIHYTDSFTVGHLATDNPFSCFLAGESHIGLVLYLVLLAAESVIALLTVLKTFDSYYKSGFNLSQLASMVYCEGLFFYFLILSFTIANVAVLLTAPPGLLLLLDSPLTVVHSIMSCRLVLHVREVSNYNSEDEDEDDLLPAFIFTVIEPYMSSKLPRYYV